MIKIKKPPQSKIPIQENKERIDHQEELQHWAMFWLLDSQGSHSFCNWQKCIRLMMAMGEKVSK